MNNENLLGIHADVEEVGYVAYAIVDDEERGRREKEDYEAMEHALNKVRAIHEEGRGDQKHWLEFAQWMMHDSEEIPREIKWGLKLHKWSTESPRESSQYWDEISKWFPDEEIPRGIRWGIAWNRWQTDLINDLKSLRARLKREANHDGKTV
jgi:hypothetical protein